MTTESDNHAFITRVLEARDALQPIVDGEIRRGHCVGGREAYGAKPGLRKTSLKDARRIAQHVIFCLNKAINKFDRGD